VAGTSVTYVPLLVEIGEASLAQEALWRTA